MTTVPALGGQMQGKTLVILGGADGALTTIAAAHRLGLRTMCVDMREEAPGARAAEEFLHLSTRDVPAIVTALADRPDIVGIMSPASDVNIPHQRAVALALGLPCAITDEAERVSTDKAYFHEVSARLGIRTPAHASGTAADVIEAAATLTWPLVVKPVDLSGGRGVVLCTDLAELRAAAEAAEEWSPTSRVIVEEFVSGRDCGAELFVVDGRVALAGVSERIIGAPPSLVTVGHSMSPDDPAAPRLAELVTALTEAIGYRDGPVNVDFIQEDAGGLVLIEMGTRSGGNGIGELVGMIHGVDSTELAVRAAVGEPVHRDQWPEPRRHAAARSFFADRTGTLSALQGLDALEEDPSVVDVIVTARPGDRVEPANQCRSKAGFMLLSAPTADGLAYSVDRALRAISVELEPEARNELAREAVTDAVAVLETTDEVDSTSVYDFGTDDEPRTEPGLSLDPPVVALQ